MKRTTLFLVAGAALALAGCATAAGPTGTVDFTKTELAVATHIDLQAAAKYADDHGFPARAAVWRAHDAHLTAVEAQATECAQAIEADLAAMAPGGTLPPSPFLAAEMAAEAVGRLTGPSARTRTACAPFPIVVLPALPRLP